MGLAVLLKEAKDKLKSASIDEYALDAEIFMAEVLNKDRLFVLLNLDYELNNNEAESFKNMISRRLNHEPAAYIIGRREFMGMDFAVEEGVLIPRPDTEILVETVMENGAQAKTCLEIGTGSGCISVSLSKLLRLNVTGVDISERCIEISQKNAKANGVDKICEFLLGDMFSPFKNDEKFDIIVSNPPYIKKNVVPSLMDDVKNFEPILALDGREDGLYFYREIINKAENYLNPNGMVFFEIGYDQKEDVSLLFKEKGFENINTVKDLSGLDRVVYATYGGARGI